MLGRLEQEQRFRTLAIDACAHRHADGNGIPSNDTPHHANALGKVHKDDIIRIGGGPRVHHGHRVHRALPARLNPIPLRIARARLREPRREEAAPTAPRSLQTQRALCQRCTPLLLRAHPGKL